MTIACCWLLVIVFLLLDIVVIVVLLLDIVGIFDGHGQNEQPQTTVDMPRLASDFMGLGAITVQQPARHGLGIRTVLDWEVIGAVPGTPWMLISL